MRRYIKAMILLVGISAGLSKVEGLEAKTSTTQAQTSTLLEELTKIKEIGVAGCSLQLNKKTVIVDDLLASEELQTQFGKKEFSYSDSRYFLKIGGKVHALDQQSKISFGEAKNNQVVSYGNQEVKLTMKPIKTKQSKTNDDGPMYEITISYENQKETLILMLEC